jgi:hypothetical protein
MQRKRIDGSNFPNSLATTAVRVRNAPRVTVHFEWLGERRERCFRIVDGELVITECQAVTEITGVGDVIAGATKALGIKPCGGCQKRQAAMNRATPSIIRRILGWFMR